MTSAIIEDRNPGSMNNLKLSFIIQLLILLVVTNTLSAQFSTRHVIDTSAIVGDRFDLYISTPPGYHADSTYRVVYYLDANILSGRKLRRLLAAPEFNQILQQVVFIGIGHKGNYRACRNRDFLLPRKNGSRETMLQSKRGQAERFYMYLKQELIPTINETFHTDSGKNSIIGHSLGGLFVVYALFKQEDLFTNYFALSPSLWVHRYAVYNFNQIDTGFTQPKNLYFTSGSMEVLNKILKGSNQFQRFLSKKSYKGLNYEYQIWKRKTHISSVNPALHRIFKEKL